MVVIFNYMNSKRVGPNVNLVTRLKSCIQDLRKKKLVKAIIVKIYAEKTEKLRHVGEKVT